VHITVVICTRDRGVSIIGTLQSLQTSTFQDFDILVVDQSRDDTTEHAIRAFMGAMPNLAYVPTCTVGLSQARNIGLRQARGPVVAYTDDDCTVVPEWLERLAGYFAGHPRVGMIFGEVRASEHDATQGFVPTFPVPRPRLVTTLWLAWRGRGIGANMAIHVEAARAAGPFDGMLGAGSALHSAEDHDMCYRVLRAGFAVLCVPDAFVIHDGFRAWREARGLMHRSAFGIAAANIKHLRWGEVALAPTFLHDWVQGVSWDKLLRLQRGSGLAYVAWYGKGALAGLRTPADRWRRIFIAPQPADDPTAPNTPQATE
jgi:glycosyltransferase involved in cell wall biosynthesis